MGKKHIGERTCMGCGKKTHKSALLRFVVEQDGRLCFDERQRAPGRGGYLCPRKACFDQAAKRRRISSRFRREVRFDPDALFQEVEERLRRREAEPTTADEEAVEEEETARGVFTSLCRAGFFGDP